jgi:hypothetical protein
MLEDDEALEVEEVDPLVLVALVEDVLVAAEVVEAELAVAEEVAPMEANALNTADTRPPPRRRRRRRAAGAGARRAGGAGTLVLWDSMVDKADNGMVSPLLVTELILI